MIQIRLESSTHLMDRSTLQKRRSIFALIPLLLRLCSVRGADSFQQWVQCVVQQHQLLTTAPFLQVTWFQFWQSKQLEGTSTFSIGKPINFLHAVRSLTLMMSSGSKRKITFPTADLDQLIGTRNRTPRSSTGLARRIAFQTRAHV